MDKKIREILRKIDKELFDPLWIRARQLQGTKAIYGNNPNLPPNVRMANIQLVQNDIIALEKKLKRRKKRASSLIYSL